MYQHTKVHLNDGPGTLGLTYHADLGYVPAYHGCLNDIPVTFIIIQWYIDLIYRDR